MQPGESSRSKKNSYRFSLGSSTSTREIFLSSNFDSGNIELVKQLSETHVQRFSNEVQVGSGARLRQSVPQQENLVLL